MELRRTILAACLLGCASPTELESTETNPFAIRNGTRDPQVLELTEGQTLALGWLHRLGNPGGNFCTGTLVTPRIVATAGHCVEGRGGGDIGFGVGLFPGDPHATFEVAQVFAHPDLDAAVLVLASDATETVPELVPIPFNREPIEQALVGTEVEAAGYGETYDRSRFGRYFAVVELIGVDRTQIHVDGRGQQGICFGDSGGPVMTAAINGEPVVLGVESWGDQSCVGVDHLTRLDVIANWIDGIEAGEPPESACGDVDYRGRCDGAMAEWCDNGQLRQRDCELRGQICEYVDDEVGFFCADPPPCGDIDVRGVCDGPAVVRCRFGALEHTDCEASGQICESDASGAFCAEMPEPEPPVEPEPPAPEPEPQPPEDPEETPVEPPDSPDDGEQKSQPDGCQAVPGTAGSTPWALALLLAMALRRRAGRRSAARCTRSSSA